jgi:hypothetical protein
VFKGSGKWRVASGKGVIQATSLVAPALWLLVVSAGVGADTVRDPTVPPRLTPPAAQTPAQVRGDYVLQSTRVSGDLRSAVINGQVVTPGERVDGALVLALDIAEARLRDGLGEFTLRLALPEVARPARHTRAPGEANP